MSIFKRGRSLACNVSRWGLLGILAGCAGLLSAGHARAADPALEALIGNAVDTSSGDYSDVTKAMTRLNRGDLEGARFNLEKAKREHKLLPPAELMLAQLLAMANQGAAVRAELENCVKLHPEDPEAYLIFGDQALTDRRFTDAGLLFIQAKAAAAKFTENAKRQRNALIRSENGLALVAEAREQWDEAKAHLNAWLAIDQNSAAGHARLGRVLFKADTSDKRIDGAKAAYNEFKEAIKDDPKSISPDIALGQLYEEAKNHERARQFMTLAVGQDLPKADLPESRLSTLIAAAHWALESDQPTEARDYSEMAVKLKPDSLEAKFLRGVAARLFKDSATAEKYLQEVFMSTPMNFSASNQYAQVLAEQNDKDKRDRALQIARINQKMYGGQNNREGIEAAATLGWVLFKMEKVNEADQVMQAVINTGNPSADSLYYKARILQDMGKSEEAKKWLDLALKVSKSFVHHSEAKEMRDMLAKRLGTDSGDDKEPSTPAADSGKTDSTKTDAIGAGKETIGPSKTTTSK
jgi:tetratricopeptide (TPR) repeat protein